MFCVEDAHARERAAVTLEPRLTREVGCHCCCCCGSTKCHAFVSPRYMLATEMAL